MGCDRMVKHTFVILAFNESDDLEECIKSVLNQSIKSNVVIATSTPNDYIMELASEYSLGVMINEEKSNKGSDYNFAINSFESRLITIAHQDDLYDRNYVKEIYLAFKKNPDATIFFTDNYEIKGDKKIKKSKELFLKRFFLFPLKYKIFQKSGHFKLRSLKRHKYICTSSVTFVKNNIDKDIFPTNFVYDNDWQGLIDLAKENSKFVYIPKKLVGYRINKTEQNIVKDSEDERILRSLYSNWYYEKVINRKKNKKKENFN